MLWALARTRNVDIAEDIAQLAMIRAQSLLDNGTPPADILRQLPAITNHLIIDHWRAQRLHSNPSSAEINQVSAKIIDQDSALFLQQLLRTLEKLPRQILKLHYYEGLTYEEIAVFCKVSPSTVRIEIEKARRRLLKLGQNPQKQGGSL